MEQQESRPPDQTQYKMDLKDGISILLTMKDDTRRSVFLLIKNGGNEGITFKGLCTLLSLKPTTLAYHLKVLKELSLIENSFKLVKGRRDFSFYTLTEKGMDSLKWTERLLANEKGQVNLYKDELAGAPREISVIGSRSGPRFLYI